MAITRDQASVFILMTESNTSADLHGWVQRFSVRRRRKADESLAESISRPIAAAAAPEVRARPTGYWGFFSLCRLMVFSISTGAKSSVRTLASAATVTSFLALTQALSRRI